MTKLVVIADDDAFVRERFAAALAAAGHHAIVVAGAADLLARVRTDLASIDLLLLDSKLPGAPGVGLVRAIRELDNGRLPILIFSGTIAMADDVRELARLGIAGYINEYSATENILPALAPHLFPDNFNRRGSPRVMLAIPVAFRFDCSIAAAVTLNLSKGGLAIRTMAPLESGGKARVTFRLPGAHRDIEAEARVSWSDRRVGMGLQFEQVAPADQSVVDDFVDRQFFTRRRD